MESKSESTLTAVSLEKTQAQLTEFKKNQKRYQDLIATFPHVKGWRRNTPLIEYRGTWWEQTLLEGCLHAQDFFQARPVDFFICSSPKTGTTWLKALAFAIVNRSRLDDSSIPLLKRNPHELVPYIEIDFPFFPQGYVLNDKGNTLFSTHMPHRLLPESIAKSGCKMVYIWRDPKDTFISMWTFFQKKRLEHFPLNNLEECFDMFCRGFSGHGPYLDHVLGYWKAYQENPDQILFLKYETMRADPTPYVKRLAEFMGYGFTAEEEKKGIVEKVVDLCSFETLKNLEANKGDKERQDRRGMYPNNAFFEKGTLEIGRIIFLSRCLPVSMH